MCCLLLVYEVWRIPQVHIDYGDCFEVTMHRQHFPEKVRSPDHASISGYTITGSMQVPFRLTRQLVNTLAAKVLAAWVCAA
jgi:hypothetical protein